MAKSLRSKMCSVKQKSKTRLGIGLLCLLLVLIGGIGWAVYRRCQEEKLDAGLLIAIKKSDSHAVHSLLAQGANANARIPEEGEQSHSLLDFCKKLLGIGVKKPMGSGTPLMYASELGNLSIVTMLVGAGADVNAQDKEGFTPLLCATENIEGHPVPIITLLVKHGANIHVQAKDGTTAWTYWRANSEIPEALQQAEARK